MVALCLAFARDAFAEPIDLTVELHSISEDAPVEASLWSLPQHGARVRALSATGGRFVYRADLRVPKAGRYVIDFRNSSTLGRFRHTLLDAKGTLVTDVRGGIQSRAPNPFLLRHGREVWLDAGRYTLFTELASPFFLGRPVPYLDTLDHYRDSIVAGNVLVLLCLGIFLGLGTYYTALCLSRRRMADGMYAAFIFGNLLYNGASLLFFSNVLGIRWFYLVSMPILLSNMAYIAFVMALLDIRRQTSPRVHLVGRVILGVLAGFALLGLAMPRWSLELDRVGVALFMSFGLAAAIARARDGAPSARPYLVAVFSLFVLGALAISSDGLDSRTFYVEHLGLLAVAVEVVLLAFVLAHQFAILNSEKESAVERAEKHLSIAYTDALTGLPNRYSLEQELDALSSAGSLTFIDLDGLKFYNDRYGHQRGDALLSEFARNLRDALGESGVLFRLGGDEFAIVSPGGDLSFVERSLQRTIEILKLHDFELAGASFGSAHLGEASTREQLKHLADTRMYEHKWRKKKSQQPRLVR